MNQEHTFKKRSVQVQAVQYTRRFAWPEWFQDRVSQGTVKVFGTGKFADPTEPCYCLIDTLEGLHRCDEGDWIIQGVKGQLYPCKRDIFEMTYEQVYEVRAA
jgi:hypothetical protein